MTPERWQEIDRIFARALEIDPSDRPSFLTEACAEDHELRHEVESLLANDIPDDSFESPAAEDATRIIASSQLELTNQIIAGYKISRTLGVGGMGHVYLAHDSRLNRPVAIKLLSFYEADEEERVRRFRQEALAASALNHPNILTIYEIGAFENQHFIVTEYVDGETLASRIEKSDITLTEAIDISIQIVSALSAAHNAAIVHRDIKPANIMLRPDGVVKVLDFGIAKHLKADQFPEQDTVVQTSPGIIVGTAAYMSPEQARGAQIDARTDIWSVGVILFETVAGHRPFVGDTAVEVIAAVLHRQPQMFSGLGIDVPDSLEQLVTKALQKDPALRYQSANELLMDLRKLNKTLEFGAPLESFPTARINTTPPSVAVMPFVNMSPDAENEYFCDGLSEELSNALAKVEELRVAARTSAFSFKGKSSTVSAIGRALNVNSVLEGSVRKSGDRLRITVQLISAKDGYQLWSERYDRKMTDIFDVQDDIALSVVDALKLKLVGSEKAAVLKRYTESVEAFELYLKGRYYWWKADPQEFLKGREYFEAALQADPSYALSYCGVSSFYGFGSAFGMIPPEIGWPKAIAASVRAGELDSTLAEVHVNAGGINMVHRRDLVAARHDMETALELNPKFQEAHLIYSSLLLFLRQFDEAISQAHQAVELDPFSARLLNNLGLTYYINRQFAEADEALRQAIDVEPMNSLFHDALAEVLLCNGQPAEAINEFKHGFECRGATAVVEELKPKLASGDTEGALLFIAKAKFGQLEAMRNQGQYVPEIHFVRALVAAGEIDRAIAILPKAVNERNLFPLLLCIDPFYSSFTSDPRVVHILRRSGLLETE